LPILDKLKETLDNPFLFELSQFAIGGLPNHLRQLIQEELQLQTGEAILDVCCGTGRYCTIATGPYLGIDINHKYIGYAIKQYGAGAGHPEREFLADDITGLAFEKRNLKFPKSMMLNSLHHLTKEQNERVLAAVARVTTERFLITDLNPEPENPVSRFLAKHDRGKYGRPLKEQVSLVEKFFRVEKAYPYYSGIGAITILVCTIY
jgi:ubiquinone/menaquinone biosynthesis C-methylase UbiE